jgi:hypothetical protein
VENKNYFTYDRNKSKFEVVVFWVVTSCSDVVRCRCFAGACCLHPRLQNPEDHDLNPYRREDSNLKIEITSTKKLNAA